MLVQETTLNSFDEETDHGGSFDDVLILPVELGDGGALSLTGPLKVSNQSKLYEKLGWSDF